MNKHKKTEMLRALKFVLFSVSAGIIQIVATTLLDLFLVYWLSYLIGLILSVLWNFTLNRKFTFKSASNMPVAMLKVAGYYLVFTPLSTLLANYLEGTLGWLGILVTIIIMVLNFTTEFLFQRFVVFKNSLDTAVKNTTTATDDCAQKNDTAN